MIGETDHDNHVPQQRYHLGCIRREMLFTSRRSWNYMAGRIGIRVGKMYQFSNNYHAYVNMLEKGWHAEIAICRCR